MKKATYYMVLLIEHSQYDNTTEENRSVVARGSGWCVWRKRVGVIIKGQHEGESLCGWNNDCGGG